MSTDARRRRGSFSSWPMADVGVEEEYPMADVGVEEECPPMADVGVEKEDPAVLAATILLSLRKRKLLRWPEWVQKGSAAAPKVEAAWPLEWWPKRRRSGGRLRFPYHWYRAAEGWLDTLPVRDKLSAPAPQPEYVAPSGSGPSTSTDRKARRSLEKAPTAVAVPKVEMKVSSPETPLDFGASGSGASSSGDDGSRPLSKRRADGGLGSGGGAASSGDEGCSLPDKRPRVDAGDDGDKAVSEPKMQAPDDSGKDAKFAFDLNMPYPEDEGFC